MPVELFHIAFLMWVVCLSPTTSTVAQTPFQKLTQRFENGQVFHAQFTHESINSYTGKKAKRSGEIWVAKNAYKIESAHQEVAVNGKISVVYDRNRQRVIISKYDPGEDDFAPSRFLNGVDSTFTIKEQRKKDNHYIIKLRSDDPFALFKEVNITLDKNSIPTKLYVIDSADNKIITDFSGGSFVQRQSNMFTLSYPDSVQIIDMRK